MEIDSLHVLSFIILYQIIFMGRSSANENHVSLYSIYLCKLFMLCSITRKAQNDRIVILESNNTILVHSIIIIIHPRTGNDFLPHLLAQRNAIKAT